MGSSGKSTLAKRIKQTFGHNWVEVDALRAFYDGVTPEDKIFHQPDWLQAKMMRDGMTEYIRETECATNNHQEYFVFEGVALDVRSLLEVLDEGKYVFICMAYQQISAGDKLAEIKKFERKNDWTTEYSDEEKLAMIETKIKESKIVKERAEKYGLKYFDTSRDRDAVLDEIIEFLRGQL